MTAAQRLRALANAAGTAGALLLLIGSGPTAGAALVDYSGLASATAAEHLLASHADDGVAGGDVQRAYAKTTIGRVFSQTTAGRTVAHSVQQRVSVKTEIKSVNALDAISASAPDAPVRTRGTEQPSGPQSAFFTERSNRVFVLTKASRIYVQDKIEVFSTDQQKRVSVSDGANHEPIFTGA